jgi:tRNA (cmo5U34)-methyltransferase
VGVFQDMIERSIPGYPLTISMISVMGDKFAQADSNIYDLGCSLGAASFAIQKTIQNKKCSIVAVDNSEAMIKKCCKNNVHKKESVEIDFVLNDILNIKIINASVIVMNFTLQFIPLEDRKRLIKGIYKGLLPGGVLILSEKVFFNNKNEDEVMIKLHHHMKELNGYEKLEIAGKRKSLEDVLVPEKIESHLNRLKKAGFEDTLIWLKCFNFVSMVAFK